MTNKGLAGSSPWSGFPENNVSGCIYPGKNNDSGGAGQGGTLSVSDVANSLPRLAHSREALNPQTP
jgi:hypothetical protein